MSGFEFAYGESELAHASGVPQKNLQRTRLKHLQQGVHWDVVDLRIAYSDFGMVTVLEKISGKTPDGEMLRHLEKNALISYEKKNGDATPPIIATVRRLFPNPYVVQIELPDGRIVNMKVRKSVNFKRGMEVPVRPLADSPLYQLTRREPRFPGRW